MEESLDCEELCCICDVTLQNSFEYSNHLETDVHITKLVESYFLSAKIANMIKQFRKLYNDEECCCTPKRIDFESYAGHLKCPSKVERSRTSETRDVSTITEATSIDATASNKTLTNEQSSMEQSIESGIEIRHSKNNALAHSKSVATNGFKISKLRKTKHHQKQLMKQYYNDKTNKLNGSDVGVVDITSRPPPNQNGRRQSEKISDEWSEADFNLLKASVQKFKCNWRLIKILCFPQKTPQEVKAAWAYYLKTKKQHDNSSCKSKKEDSASDGGKIRKEKPDSSNECSFHRSHQPQMPSNSQDSDCEFLEDEESLPLSLIKKRAISAQQSSSKVPKPHSLDDESLTLSSLKQQFIAAKQPGDNVELKTSGYVFGQHNEDVPLAKLKVVQSFDNYLKELPLEVRKTICLTLATCGIYRANKHNEVRLFRQAMISLLSIINVLQSSKIFTKYSDIESQMVAQLSEESKHLFRSTLTFVRDQMSSRLNCKLRNFSEVIRTEKAKEQLMNVGSDGETVFDTISNGSYSPSKSIKIIEKLSSKTPFRDALKSLLSEYLNVFYVPCISQPRDEVLKDFITRTLIPAWNSAICGDKAKLRGGVTVDIFLEISRQVLDSKVKPNQTKNSASGKVPDKRMKLAGNTGVGYTSTAGIKVKESSTTNREPIYIDSDEPQTSEPKNVIDHSAASTSGIADCLNEDLDTPLANLKKTNPKS